MPQPATPTGKPAARRRAPRLLGVALVLLALALAPPAAAAAFASPGATVIPPPTISGFTPTAGPVGAVVNLTGSGFSGATVVELVHAEAAFTVLSDARIRLTVPAGARSGRIGVTTPGGSAVSAAWFTVGPTVKSFTPASGPAGTLVTLTGINFTNATRVAFNGARATRFRVVSPAQITAIAPAAATTGPIGVTTRAGSSLSATSFTVTAAAPLVTVSAPTGTGSYLRGDNLTVSWTIAPDAAAGEFGLWARSPAGGWYIGKLVPASGAASFTASLTLDVPTGGGYQAIVAWRAAAGGGAWTSFGTSPGSFTVIADPAAKAITAFSFQGLTPPVAGAINEAEHTIALTVPKGTNVSALVATFTTTGAAVEVTSTPQVSGVTANDFTSPVAYTVTAADASTQDYLVTAKVKAADRLSGDESSFFGSLLSKIVSGLISGASGKVGNAAMGEILSLLGWGDNNSANAAALQEMDTELGQIETELTLIGQELANLETELKITEEEILANTNDPTAAITEIGTYMDELEGMADNVSPGGGNQTLILAFASQVEDDFRIENDVNTIHDAIIPPDSAKAPVLDNYTDLAIAKVAGGADLCSAYLGLEQYFTQLIYHQMRGVDLVVEAKQAEAAANQPVGTPAAAYLATFLTNKLAPEVQDFMDNVWRLILSQAALDHTADFLPAEAEAIVSRAEFMRTQILDLDHFGLRAHVVVTDDCVGQLGPDFCVAQGPSHEWAFLSSTTSAVNGPTYDWWSGQTVTSSSNYTIMTFDFGATGAATYDIYGPDFIDFGSATVQGYDDDYTPDSAGAIMYGSSVGSTRTGAIEGFALNVATRSWVKPGAWNVSCTGTAALGFVAVQGNKQNDSYGGTNEVDYIFTFGGSAPAQVSIPFGANPIGSEGVSCNADAGGSANATMSYGIGVWDSTAGDFASGTVNGSQSIYTNDSASMNRTVDQTLTFTAQPGHEYYVFFSAEVDGDSQYGSSRASVQVGCGGGLEVQFPD